MIVLSLGFGCCGFKSLLALRDPVSIRSNSGLIQLRNGEDINTRTAAVYDADLDSTIVRMLAREQTCHSQSMHSSNPLSNYLFTAYLDDNGAHTSLMSRTTVYRPPLLSANLGGTVLGRCRRISRSRS